MKHLLLFLSVMTFAISGFSQVEDTTFQNVEEVVISAQKQKEIVFSDPKYYIVDFTVHDTFAILLMKNFGTYFLYELDRDMNFRHKLKLSINADFLMKDCFENTRVVTKDSVYFVLNDSLGLFITEKHSRRHFMHAMSKCAGSTSEKIVIEKKSNYNQDQLYYTVDIDSGDRKIVYEMKDNEITRSMREAAAQLYLKDWVPRARMAEDGKGGNYTRDTETSMSQELNAQRILNGMQDRATFVASHVLKPKYNPLFTVDDTLYVFNHVDGRAEILSQNGEVVRSVPITYHLNKKWDKKVYADRVEKEFYAVKLRNGVQQLIRLALRDGEQQSVSEITKHAYPKKVVVRGGYAYYTYKESFESNLNTMYRQKL